MSAVSLNFTTIIAKSNDLQTLPLINPNSISEHYAFKDSYTNLPSDNTNKKVALSFQIMTRAEPPELVIKTIESLLAVKQPQDEILIVDNNNTKVHLYQPLADYCQKLNPKLKVRFYHVDAIKGYKAGALNLALQLMDRQCSHIVVVDSDYQALAHARNTIKQAILQHPNHSLLQFPQFYRSHGQVDIHSELNHYFNHHLYRPFNRIRALSTGTFAVIKVDDLIKLGGWSSESITEDAQMGVLMHRHGMNSEFIPKVIASGILPNTLKDLIAQRRRWIYGNMQVLKKYFRSSKLIPASDENFESVTTTKFSNNEPLSYGQRFSLLRAHLSQLTAWVNLTGPFIVFHMLTLMVIAGSVFYPSAEVNVFFPLALIYSSYALFITRRLWAYLQDSSNLNKQFNDKHQFKLSDRLRTWLLHLNFWELGALSWLPVLWGQSKPFTCTPKQKIMNDDKAPWIKDLIVAPKLLLILNFITALMVSPISEFYSPSLFACAVGFFLLKLASILVTVYNFSNSKPLSRLELSSDTILNKS